MQLPTPLLPVLALVLARLHPGSAQESTLLDVQTARSSAILLPGHNELLILGGQDRATLENGTTTITASPLQNTITRVSFFDWSITTRAFPLDRYQFNSDRSCISQSGSLICALCPKLNGTDFGTWSLLSCNSAFECSSHPHAGSVSPDAVGLIEDELYAEFIDGSTLVADLLDPFLSFRSVNNTHPKSIDGGHSMVRWNDTSLLIMRDGASSLVTVKDGKHYWEDFSSRLDPTLQLSNGTRSLRQSFSVTSYLGKIYLFGGTIEGRGFNNILSFDPRAPERGWTDLSSNRITAPLGLSSGQPTQRHLASMTGVGDLLMIYGGVAPNLSGSATDSHLYFFNLTSKSWVPDYKLIDLTRLRTNSIVPRAATAAAGAVSTTQGVSPTIIAWAITAFIVLMLITIAWRRSKKYRQVHGTVTGPPYRPTASGGLVPRYPPNAVGLEEGRTSGGPVNEAPNGGMSYIETLPVYSGPSEPSVGMMPRVPSIPSVPPPAYQSDARSNHT
ncbi:hypothetical protein DFJ77DRAFT_288232 [Powellomyces hirtus]|nr:hypothetical protein DFJ77DRAFT_288232 [Powellomyces hirtus]